MLPALLLSATVAWWMPCCMLLGMGPLMWFRAHAERVSWDVLRHHAATFNDLRILERLLIEPAFAKEVRMYSMQALLLGKWREAYSLYILAISRTRLRNAIGLLWCSLFTSCCLALPFYALISGIQNGQYAIADFVLILGTLAQLKEGLSGIIFNFGDMLGLAHAIEPYRQLLTLYQTSAVPVASPPCEGAWQLQVCDVSFRYSSDGPEVLRDINLNLAAGECVVLVGDNGAGKSSLIKLICGFYSCSSGQIRSASGSRLPKVVGVLQDFAHFPMTPLENLIGDNIEMAQACLRAVGLDFLCDKMATPLSSECRGGIDLSGGQWQRLAIARAMLHAPKADLLVFDEPTAALDPESEAAVMQLILRAASGKATVIASHRLALTRRADRIIVLEHGAIIEQGEHATLMAANGKYARMFRAQADHYVEEAQNFGANMDVQ